MNKYEILGIVGEGAYGIVYKAKIKAFGWVSVPNLSKFKYGKKQKNNNAQYFRSTKLNFNVLKVKFFML